MNLIKIYAYTQEKDGKDFFVVDAELPGVDPASVKLSYTRNAICLNGSTLVRIGEKFDLSQAKAELKYGLLTVTVPSSFQNAGEISLTIRQ